MFTSFLEVSVNKWQPVFMIVFVVNYSGRELPYVVVVFFFFRGGGRLPVFMLIGWRAANNHVVCSWAKYSWENDMEQALLTQLGHMDCLLERSYHLQTHSPAAVDPH